MDTRLRRVVKLRLRSADDALNRRGAILIEDALRTASMPDAGGSRLLLIRKLRLGRIRVGSPPSAISLRMEALCRELGEFAVHAASPEASGAAAVYFDDDLDPYTTLALLAAGGDETSAWFWPLAARGWTPGLPRDETMRVALAGALASSAGPSAALALIRALLRRGLIVPLISALRQEDGADLLRAFGWTRPQSAALAAMGARPSLTDPPSHLFAAIAAPWFAAWGREDARSLWLACALCAIERPALMAQRSLTGKAAAWIASFCVESDDEAPSERSTSSDILSAGLRPPLDVLQFDRPVNTPVFDSRSPEPIPAFLPEAATSTKPEPPPLPQWKGAQHTPRAGLFFLVPVMDRLGIDRWMAENPEMAAWSFPNLVLRDVAVRLGARPSDPVLAALGELDHEIPGAVRAAVQDWTRRIRQYTRRVARIGLHNLVCRPGRITARQTHIDVMFRLELVDIRVRRAGLDIDPGWTPWLLRVIHFHYVAGDVYDT